MNQAPISATVLHTDTEAERFYVLKTPDNNVLYSHWRVFQKAGFSSVRPGQKFSIQMGRDDRDDQTEIVSEVLSVLEEQEEHPNVDGADSTGHRFSTDELRSMLDNADDGLFVVRNKHIESSELRDLDLPSSIVFIGCIFEGSIRLLSSVIHGDVWFLNCEFKEHLSLRGSSLDGNVVLFGCDFSGPGGISFRGLRGRSILIEYGARGSDDMLWLNELSLTGCIALSGTFAAPVQIRARQDDRPINRTPATLQRVVIGKQDKYAHESLSKNRFLGGIECRGYHLQDSFEVHNSEIRELVIKRIDPSHILVNNCEISRDVVMEQVQPRDEERGIAIASTVIQRRLLHTGNSLSGNLNLEGTSVGQTWALELTTPRLGVPHAKLRRFHANAAWFEPIEIVYGATIRRGILRPPHFGLLEGPKKMRRSAGEDCLDLAEAYTSCKNWLAASGHLREEDHAFFHMREAKERRLLVRLLFGTLFGWGIHLRNILLSAIGLIVLFALFYMMLGTGNFIEMLILSAQSFIPSFFGRWPDYSPFGTLSILVTIESLFGVGVITTLIGCYIRKLLR